MGSSNPNIKEPILHSSEKTKFSLNSELFKNSFLLIGGNAIGQALSFLVYPLLTRLYSAEDFGLLASFLSVVGLLSILSTGKYEDALFLTKEDKETNLLLGFTIKVLIVFASITAILLFLFKSESKFILQHPKLYEYWYLIPLTILFTGLFQILGNLANKTANYKSIASSNILLNGASSLCKIIFGYFPIKGIGMIIGNLLGQIIACLSFSRLRQQLLLSLKNKWEHEKIIGLKYKDFPLFNMSKSFINSFSGNLPFLVLGLFGEASLGLYSLAFTSIFRPVNLVSNSLYKVFFQKTALSKLKNERISPPIQDFITKSFLFIFPFFVLAFFISEPMFAFIFGNEWKSSGIYFQFILPWMFMVFITTPLGFIPVVFEKQKTALYLEVGYLILRGLALGIGIYLKNFETAIFIFSIVGFGYISIMLLWYLSLIHNYEKQINK